MKKKGDKMKIVAMIPARIGSTRLRMKNLALLDGKPLIYYAIDAAKRSGVFDRILLNSDHDVFGMVAERYGIEFYKRPVQLGSSSTKSDDVVNDFILNNPSDIIVWVNPTSPLQTAGEIKKVIDYFIEERLDTLITVQDLQVHCLYKNKPVNFDIEKKFDQTQDLTPVQPYVYSIMMWKSETFREQYNKKGYALFCGNVGHYPVSKESALIIKKKEDLILAENLLKAKNKSKTNDINYDDLVNGLEI